jgi:hypothetical protein
LNGIKIYFGEIGCGGVDWIDMAQGRVQCEHSGYIKGGEFID